MIRAPFAADEELLDCGAEHNQDNLCENQGTERAHDRLSAQAQQNGVQNYIDQHPGEGQNADAEDVIQEDTRQEKGEARQSLGFVLRLEVRTRESHWRVSRHRDRLAEPRTHLAPELYVIPWRGDPQQKIGREVPRLRDAIVAAEEVRGHVKLAKL